MNNIFNREVLNKIKRMSNKKIIREPGEDSHYSIFKSIITELKQWNEDLEKQRKRNEFFQELEYEFTKDLY